MRRAGWSCVRPAGDTGMARRACGVVFERAAFCAPCAAAHNTATGADPSYDYQAVLRKARQKR